MPNGNVIYSSNTFFVADNLVLTSEHSFSTTDNLVCNSKNSSACFSKSNCNLSFVVKTNWSWWFFSFNKLLNCWISFFCALTIASSFWMIKSFSFATLSAFSAFSFASLSFVSFSAFSFASLSAFSIVSKTSTISWYCFLVAICFAVNPSCTIGDMWRWWMYYIQIPIVY